MAADSGPEYKLQKGQFAESAREVFLSSSAADLRNEVNFVAIDFETANYDMRSACSIGAAISQLVAHNMRFDRSVLLSLIAHYGLRPPESTSLCSLGVARRAWPNLRSHSLFAVASHLNIELDHHNAESDAAASAAVVLCACAKYGAKDIEELASLLRCRRERLLGARQDIC